MRQKLIYIGEDFPEDTDDVVYIAARVSGIWHKRKVKYLNPPYGPYEYLEWK